MAGYLGAVTVGLDVTSVDVEGDITSTDASPEVTLQNTTEEDTDGGRESKITFKGEQSGGEITTLAQIQASHDGAADDEKGDLIFSTNDGADGNVPTERVRIDSAGNVGIGTSSPSAGAVGGKVVHVQNSGGTASVRVDRSDATTAGTLSMTSGNTTNGFYGTGAKSMVFSTDSSERMRIDSSGNVGINFSAPSRKLYVASDDSSTGGNVVGVRNNNSTAGAFINFIAGGANAPSIGAKGNDIVFTADGYSGTESMRLNNDGDLLINSTGSSYGEKLKVINSGSTGNIAYFWFTGTEDRSNCIIRHNRASGGTTATMIDFLNAGATSSGRINSNGSSTSYITSSDYRLKENVTDVDDGITRVKQLAPKRFNFIAEPNETVDGFLAHEVQDVVPEAISGAKDAMRDEEYEVTPAVLDDDGNVVTEAVMGTRSVPDYQGIDQSKLVPLLTAALQEAIAKIETLETKVAALESA